MPKYKISLKRWEPFDITIEVAASSKNAACKLAKEQAKTYAAYVASNHDEKTPPKVSVQYVRDA